MGKHQCTVADQGEEFCLDYMQYLSASCKKRWSFIDAIYGVMPIFGIVTKSMAATGHSHQEQLKALALQVLSTQVNDETNIIRLIALADRQGIHRFAIQLPYALENHQLTQIRQEIGAQLCLQQHNDRLLVSLATVGR